MVRRFSAIDARYMKTAPDPSVLTPTFSLADQLTVDPNPLLEIDDAARAHEIAMTRQEIAVALSHIEIWKKVAGGDVPSALILEDDVFMPFGFATELDATWSALPRDSKGEPMFDLLYLSFKEVGEFVSAKRAEWLRRPDAGVWQASGYVLSREGARKLLNQLPAHGPIDLWLNLQFNNLDVFIARVPLFEQRIDEPSTNSYSILPVLSQVGVVTKEKPLVHTRGKLRGPVIAVGGPGSGLTALAKALSMLGYTCWSDAETLPNGELSELQSRRGRTRFSAYVNVGELDDSALVRIAASNPVALFIDLSKALPTAIDRRRVLKFARGRKDPWDELVSFLGLEYPPFDYPSDEDLGVRATLERQTNEAACTRLQFDQSPWIVATSPINSIAQSRPQSKTESLSWRAGEALDNHRWQIRTDTFPSNLSLFTRESLKLLDDGALRLVFERQPTAVRNYTSAALASVSLSRYGRFSAELRPPKVSGLITGLFLHRNGPRQEIDIEFLGRDTTKMLVNVYFNPGPEGTKLEYGYRGTPTLIDLGFDAADDFHHYEIEWLPDRITWRVDGHVVYSRTVWDPTPIPDMPMEFDINLWHSRSIEFAGRLDETQIPAEALIRSIQINPPSEVAT